MALIAVWTELAETQLKDIHTYYRLIASRKTADRLVDKIISSTNILKNHPRVGQREELLMHRAKEYRYLVTGHYKLIYRTENESIYISSVFDCRQDPEKLKGLLR